VAYINEFIIKVDNDYLSLNRRFTKSVFGPLTIPLLFIVRLRFFDFFVRMCRLKAFWNVIFPVPVTLNLFLALEFVFTLGILWYALLLHPTGAPHWQRLMGPFGQCCSLAKWKAIFLKGAQR
jgi:hypothetical protein